MKNELALFGLAIQFLTRLPIPLGNAYSAERMATSVRYYPLVGALIGALCAAILLLSTFVFNTLIAVLFSVASGLLLTGAFHEDGLADTFDGIGGGQNKAKALEIMRDSRLGTYGSAALILVLALKVAALASLPVGAIAFALIAGHALSRCSAVIVIATSRYVRDEGTGKPVSEGISLRGLIFAMVTAAIAATPLMTETAPTGFGVGILGLVVAHFAIRLFFERKLGGYTGDTLGAVQQISEIGFYLGIAAWA